MEALLWLLIMNVPLTAAVKKGYGMSEISLPNKKRSARAPEGICMFILYPVPARSLSECLETSFFLTYKETVVFSQRRGEIFLV